MKEEKKKQKKEKVHVKMIVDDVTLTSLIKMAIVMLSWNNWSLNYNMYRDAKIEGLNPFHTLFLKLWSQP